MTNLLKDHIDAPIRKAVAGMSLLGYKTKMSCCGFSYSGEEVPKTHLGKSYIYLDYKSTSENAPLCQLLTRLCLASDWKFSNVGYKYIDFYSEGWKDPNHNWKPQKAVHNYEVFILDINKLNKSLDFYKKYFADQTTINDGNEDYLKEVSSFWQYKPCEPWTVTKEEWDAIPS